MNEHNENFEALTPDLAALDAGLSELGAVERGGAPAGLEGRIVAATSGLVTSHAPKPLKLIAARPEPRGVLGRLSVRRLDWPMRVAAVITVMIGGWAVFYGVNNPIPGPAPSANPPGSAEAERLLAIWSTLENGGASEKIQNLLNDAANLRATLGNDDFGVPDLSDPENL